MREDKYLIILLALVFLLGLFLTFKKQDYYRQNCVVIGETKSTTFTTISMKDGSMGMGIVPSEKIYKCEE